MAFNIDRFINIGLRHGGVRPTLFEVLITFPPRLREIPTGASEKLRFTCQAASVPPMSISPIEVPYFGRTIKVAGDRTFQDWTVTILNDEDFSVRNAMEAWMNNINSIISNRRLVFDNPRSGYKGTALVRQFSKQGNGGDGGVIKMYEFVNIFPNNLSEMTLGWNETNQIQTFTVTFSYDYYLPIVNNIGLEGGPVSPRITPNA